MLFLYSTVLIGPHCHTNKVNLESVYCKFLINKYCIIKEENVLPLEVDFLNLANGDKNGSKYENTLFVEYSINSVICRPSDRRVGRAQARFEPWTAGL